MRKPGTIERLYLDFDGFFASVEQQADRRLRGRPVGVVPVAGTDRTMIIACSREAKLRDISNIMPVRDALADAEGVQVHHSSIGRALERLGFTYKKSRWSLTSAAVSTSPLPAPTG
ncbi:hypothetical protein FHS81_002152 [Pseudochelatococcus contaminans]|uniref:UmuC domain-containing protein n=1 Tax=Pseudochelatococcus contaminans TaxID=1538103 RepID=A0A7W6EHD0_9HYPH|nr:hypothetical protein [Pseudochelatococcus contaminans]